MSELLKSYGAEVYTFDQGGLAIEWLETHLPDCDGVLTDIRMPIMDGFAVARHIREELGLTQLPIIAVTGERMEKHASKETTGLFNETITKPFQPKTLIESLKKHVGSTGAVRFSNPRL